MKDNMQSLIEERIYQQFIKPTNQKKDFIGIEIEVPIINLNKQAVDFGIVHKVTSKVLDHFKDFKKEGIDYNGDIFSIKNPKNDDIICYDCSYNNIEFAMGREKDLFTINDRFVEYYSFVKEEFEKHNHTLTGMGINPYRKYNEEIPIPSERYLMLYHHLKSFKNYKNVPMHFHNYPAYNKHVTCFRDALWEYSTHGINPHNIGMYDVEFNNLDDLGAYLESLNIYCVMRDGAYINFPTMNLQEYFKKDYVRGEIYSNGKYRYIDVKPLIDDINYLRPFKFINLTFRGTVEFRSVCTQPIYDTMTVAAFHLGLKNRLDELAEIITNDNVIYHKGYTARELRKLLIQDEIPSFIDKDELCRLTKDIVDLANDGLCDRGIGEEKFLKPLYRRIRDHTNPGKNIIESMHRGIELEKIIKDYGKIKE